MVIDLHLVSSNKVLCEALGYETACLLEDVLLLVIIRPKCIGERLLWFRHEAAAGSLV